MEKSNTIVNGIKLQDGRVMQCYPIQQDAVMEEAKETPVLDKTGVYFSIKKKPAKPKTQTPARSTSRQTTLT